ncbi:DUF4193 family protein [Streptomyces sp. NPDC012825]|uniref:DUF4193 family protein n=1 Tax=Streptomyces sp. NPDC012825 TaxID=3364851 RepID=UPI0036AADC66
MAHQADGDDIDTEAAEGMDPLDADNEELAIRVMPKVEDQFTCVSCFRVRPRSELAAARNGDPVCTDCA